MDKSHLLKAPRVSHDVDTNIHASSRSLAGKPAFLDSPAASHFIPLETKLLTGMPSLHKPRQTLKPYHRTLSPKGAHPVKPKQSLDW